jgi:hypothetical protein
MSTLLDKSKKAPRKVPFSFAQNMLIAKTVDQSWFGVFAPFKQIR